MLTADLFNKLVSFYNKDLLSCAVCSELQRMDLHCVEAISNRLYRRILLFTSTLICFVQ